MNIILKSIKDKDGKSSTTRIISYVITILIVLLSFVFMILTFMQEVISNELIIVFGSLLTHQLALLGINKKIETKNDINRSNKPSND